MPEPHAHVAGPYPPRPSIGHQLPLPCLDDKGHLGKHSTKIFWILTSRIQPGSRAALNLLSVPPDQEASTSLKHNLSQPWYRQILQIFCVLLQSSNFSSPPKQVATSQEH
uniref:Uncharacterized protein n=1 Tax=Opuntia streptacantha TaxID=393608 RepID=A0A7C9AV75_OPUST